MDRRCRSASLGDGQWRDLSRSSSSRQDLQRKLWNFFENTFSKDKWRDVHAPLLPFQQQPPGLTQVVVDFHPKPRRHFKSSRKFKIVEIHNGSSRTVEMQTPELLRLVHLHNKEHRLADVESGSLKLRDLRQITFSSVGAKRWSIEPRRSCILINLPGHIRALVLHDRMYMIDTDNEEINMKLVSDLERITDAKKHVFQTGGDSAPFEFNILEVLLIETCQSLSDELCILRTHADELTARMEADPNGSLILREMNVLKRRVDDSIDKAKGVARALGEILEEDIDLWRLQVSIFWEDPSLWDDSRQSPGRDDLELLIENYEQEIDSTLTQLVRIDETLDDGLQMMELYLSSSRNAFLKAELGLDVVGTVIAFLGIVTGIFGMNIPNGLEETFGVFWPITHTLMATIFVSAILVVCIFRKMRL